MERASVAAYILPLAAIVSPRVASAMEGAAPNNPAKLFGLSTSPKAANAETTIPPITKRKIRSFTRPPEVQKLLVNTDGYRVANSTPVNPHLEPPGLEMRI